MINENPVDTWWTNGQRLGYKLAADVASRPQLGAVAALNAAGEVVSAAHASAVRAIGRADEFLPAAEDTGYNEDRIIVRRGVISLFNDATNPVDDTHLFAIAEVGADDATAANSTAATLALGPVISLSEGRVYVLIDGVS